VTAGIADTSVFIARESGRALDVSAFPDDVAVSIITLGELRAGVLAAVDIDTRDRRLATFSGAQALDPIPIDEPVADAWARLRLLLRDSGQRMPVNDSWIAATAMSLGVAIVTHDDDYIEVPGLLVIKV
jgi:predicted nucleic acid-binding protein